MSDKKLLTIFGATGNQGGSAISVIINNPSLASQFSLRAVTRDTTSAKAQALASKGVELTKANLDDASTIASAVRGSYGVFGLTDYWATTNKQIEEQQGRNIVDASVKEGVKHLIWSCLPDPSKVTEGVLAKIEHFESKANVFEYANKHKGDMIVSAFMPGYFMSNLLTSIKKTDDGTIALSLPWNAEKTWLPLLDIRGDSGKYIAGLFAGGKAADGVAVQAVSQWVHPIEVTKLVSEISGQDVKFIEQPVTVEMTEKMDRIPAELTQNMLLIRDYSYYGKGTETKQEESDKWLADGTTKNTWDAFARGQKWEFK